MVTTVSMFLIGAVLLGGFFTMLNLMDAETTKTDTESAQNEEIAETTKTEDGSLVCGNCGEENDPLYDYCGSCASSI